MTAAHPALPFGTRVRVTNLSNRRSVVVRINDRGPFVKGRIVDLSYAAARQLRMVGPGVAPVEVEKLRRLPVPSGARRLWRRRAVAPWGPLAARIDATRVRNGV
jgi:rare lipoprotein A